MYLIANGKVVTRDEGQPWIADGGVLVEGATIKEVGETAALKARYPRAEFIDAQGMVIMPAFINVHTHIYSALARGLAIAGNNPTDFLEILEGTWWAIDRRLTLESTRRSAYATFIDCIKTGCTTLFDHHASSGAIEGSLFVIEEAAKELGLRACLCYEVSDRDGPAKRDAAIRENGDFIRHCAGRQDPLIAAMFGGHALFTLSDRTLEKMVRENNGQTGFHLHVAEGLNDVYDSARNYGTRPVNRLLNHGLLGPGTLLAHCIHVNSGEMDILRDTGTMVCNNAESNMNNAVGCAPLLPMMQKGILVGMGTDAYTFDMLEALKATLLIQRHHACLPNVAWRESAELLFKNNRQIAAKYFPDPLGMLKSGAAADLIIMDYQPFTPLDAANIDGHLLFGMAGRQCEFTMCSGRILMQDRRLVGIDEEAVNARTLEAAKQLWGQLNRRSY